ncbi:MAG: iron permease FTR1 family protein [Rhodobiaceae bacterium]|nr:iron permease FTR1 family protein [Rhodobiaceae bacterium]
MNEFIITFRECLEASLIVGIIYTVLQKNNLTREKMLLWYAVLSSVAASMIVAYILTSINESVGNTSYEKLFEAIFMYITAVILFYVIFWLAKHVGNRNEIEESVKSSLTGSRFALFLLIFFSTLREGFETALFLIASFTSTGTFSYIGFFLGVVLAVFIGYIVVIQGKRVNLRSFFQVTTLLLVFFAAGMVAYGTHEAEEYLVKSTNINENEIARVWDIHQPKKTLSEDDNEIFYTFKTKKNNYYHILNDKGSVGVFLKAFFGYNSNPNWVELILWLLSLLFGIRMWYSFYQVRS